jgi:YfiR/HmsC-like
MARTPLCTATGKHVRWRCLNVLFVLGCSSAVVFGPACSPSVFAQADSSQYTAKAIYLINFGRFVRHPDGHVHHATFDICILGHDPIEQTMDGVAAKESIDGAPVRVPRAADAAETRACEVVYVTRYEGKRIREDMAILAGAEALTVSDMPNFLERGGMIQFVQTDNRVRFAVNLNALNQSHLTLSSELLKVALSVTGKSPEVQP